MTNRPIISVMVPWRFANLAKEVQASAKTNDRVALGGNREALSVTATVQDFLRLGLAKQSWDISDQIVGRLRSASIPVKASRTVKLPGGVVTVEISTDADMTVARKIARTLVREGSSDIATIYDRGNHGHTAWSEGLKVKGAAVMGAASGVTQGAPRGVYRLRKQAAKASSYHTGLVNAIRDIWENNGDDLAMLLDWDSSDYETPDIQDLILSVLSQYLSENLLEEWNNLESEQQSAVMEQAFPRNALRETAETLDQHFENTVRGASRKPKTLQASPSPLDLGLKDDENLVRLSQGGSINELF